MFKTLVKQEIQALLKSKRVIWSIAIFLVLYATVFLVRVNDYNHRVQSYIQNVENLGSVDYSKITNYSYIDIPVIKKPTLYSIFNEGDTHKRGSIYTVEPLTYVGSPNKGFESSNFFFEEPVNLDITFLITFFFSLFVLLITFDSVNREKEEKILRLLFSYPIKRSMYIVKKMVGSLFFISLVFLIPYFLSAIYLAFAYNNNIDSGFVWFMVFYGVVGLIFLFVMSLIGIFTSLITKESNKSLIYALSIWILLIIIVPTSYDFISREALSDKIKLHTLNKEFTNLQNKLLYINDNISDDINPERGSHWNWNGGMYKDLSVIAADDTNDKHCGYLKYYYDEILPQIQEREKLAEEILRIKSNSEFVKPYYLSFAPNAQFESAANMIAMNSTKDYMKFKQQAVNLRDELTNLGAREGWLFNKSYFSTIDTSYVIMNQDEYIFIPGVRERAAEALGVKELTPEVLQKMFAEDQGGVFERIGWVFQEYYQYLDKELKGYGKVEMDTSQIPQYDGIEMNPTQLLEEIWYNIAFMLGLALALFIVNVQLFKRFDLR